MTARNSDPQTNHEAAAAFQKKVGKVDGRIIEIVRASGQLGRTQSEVVASVPEYKPGSITPRFVWLVERRQLVRIRIGTTKPTKRNPGGRPLYITRFDEETKRPVNVYWAPEFAPEEKEPPVAERNGGQDAFFSEQRSEDARQA